MPKISIITPVYNSEKYLEQCINSIINQTFKDIELILIDDGSTDNSGVICDKYAESDKRVRVIHKNNAGMGVSYNLGIKEAKGDYIGFIESDDFANINMYEALYNLASKYNVDIVKSAWFKYYTSDDIVEKDFQLAEFNDYEVLNIKNCPWFINKQFSVWSAIYRTDFLRKNNVYYLETPGASYQDVGFSYKAFFLSNNFLVTPNAYIYYRQDNENSSVNSVEKANVIFWEYEEVDRFFSSNPEIKEYANSYKLYRQYFDYQWNYNRIKNELKPEFLKHFKRDFSRYKARGELDETFYKKINKENFELLLS